MNRATGAPQGDRRVPYRGAIRAQALLEKILRLKISRWHPIRSSVLVPATFEQIPRVPHRRP